MSERPGYDPNQWESQPATGERNRPVFNRLEAIRNDPVVQEKARRLGGAALNGGLKELGISFENGNVKVKPIKAARTLANPGGAAARALNGARKGVRNEAIGMGREMLSGPIYEATSANPQLSSTERQPDYWSDTSLTETQKFDSGFGESAQTSSWDTDGFGAPLDRAPQPTTEWSSPAAQGVEDYWGTPIQSERSSAPSESWNDPFGTSESFAASPQVPTKKRFERQSAYEDRVIAEAQARMAQRSDSSDMW